MKKQELKVFITDDYQNRNGNYPESDEPDTINIYNSNQLVRSV